MLTDTERTICRISDLISGIDGVNLLVGTGVSGLLPLLAVSLRTKIPFAVVRKETDLIDSHASSLVETQYSFDDRSILDARYVIIDDLIETGETIDKILAAMKRFGKSSECVGICLYNADDYPEVDMSIPIYYIDN